MPQRWMRTFGLAAAVLLGATAWAQTPAPAPAPASAPAIALPSPDDSNAQRANSQPGNNAPFWRAVRESGEKPGVTNLPGAELGVLVQPQVQYPGALRSSAGEAWRQVRNNRLLPYGAALLFITVLALALLYWRRGTLGGSEADTGRKIERFTPFERAAHWSNAIAFVVLAVSGLVMAFGKFFVLPILGGTLFGWLAWALKTAHNFAGPLFAVSLLIVIFTFVKDNFPKAVDLDWIKQGGGLLGGHETASHRFNAGEKLLFWGAVCLAGLVVVLSGLALDHLLPVVDYTRGNMQIAHMLHAAAALLMLAAMLGHIYMGTIGMKGAYSAMKTGWVDEGWAKEHHALWYDDIRAGRIPAQRSGASPNPSASPNATALPSSPAARA